MYEYTERCPGSSIPANFSKSFSLCLLLYNSILLFEKEINISFVGDGGKQND